MIAVVSGYGPWLERSGPWLERSVAVEATVTLKFRLHNTDPPVIHNTAASVLHRGPGFKLPRRRSARVFKLAARWLAGPAAGAAAAT